MLTAMGWPATEIIGSIEEQRIDIRAEHVAAAAVMAGCSTEYGPLLRAPCRWRWSIRPSISVRSR